MAPSISRRSESDFGKYRKDVFNPEKKWPLLLCAYVFLIIGCRHEGTDFI